MHFIITKIFNHLIDSISTICGDVRNNDTNAYTLWQPFVMLYQFIWCRLRINSLIGKYTFWGKYCHYIVRNTERNENTSNSSLINDYLIIVSIWVQCRRSQSFALYHTLLRFDTKIRSIHSLNSKLIKLSVSVPHYATKLMQRHKWINSSIN